MSAPKERGLSFTGSQVRAILDGRMSQTRRVVKPQPTVSHVIGQELLDIPSGASVAPLVYNAFVRCPYGQPGDRLWLRETWMASHGDEYAPNGTCPPALYAADEAHYGPTIRWRSPVTMPRWASRITLEITGVRVERVQDISHDDAIAEGARHFADLPTTHPYPGSDARWSMEEPTHTHQCLGSPRSAFGNLWNKLNAKRGYGWDANPWCWVIEFRRVA